MDAPDMVSVPVPAFVTPFAADASEITPDITAALLADTFTVALSLSRTSPDNVALEVNASAPALDTPVPRIRSGSAVDKVPAPATSSVAPSETMVYAPPAAVSPSDVFSVTFSVPLLTVTLPVNVLDDDGESVSVLVLDVSFVRFPDPVMTPESVWFADDE